MNARVMSWLPASVLVTGSLLTFSAGSQRTLELRAPLARTVPQRLAGGDTSWDATLSADEGRVVGVSNYLLRNYGEGGKQRVLLSVYVGYYDRQSRGKTIHSPKNCLPGSGWEALNSEELTISTADGVVPVNAYLIQRKAGNGFEQALVLYWYQGRGRVVADEYAVKWNLLRDAALRRRSDEALVRIVVPVGSSTEQALGLGRDAARQLIPALTASLPL